MRVGRIGPGESLDLRGLQAAVLVEKRLKESARPGRWVIKVLVLPVGPASEVLIADLANVRDLIDAALVLAAATELTDE